MLFIPFHVPRLVGLSLPRVRRGEVRVVLRARLDTGLGKPGLLLATPPHWPVKIQEERDLGRAI